MRDRLGIERVILSQGYSADLHPTRDQIREENTRVMRAVRRFPERAYGSVYLSPSFLDFSLQEFDRCVATVPWSELGNWKPTCDATRRNWIRSSNGRSP